RGRGDGRRSPGAAAGRGGACKGRAGASWRACPEAAAEENALQNDPSGPPRPGAPEEQRGQIAQLNLEQARCEGQALDQRKQDLQRRRRRGCAPRLAPPREQLRVPLAELL